MIRQYLNILEVSPNSGILEIKRAFRKKAKKFHPDLNKDSGAQDKFILVNEAYEFLMKHYNQPGFKSKKTPEERYRDWVEREKAKARKHAARQAQRQFEKYRNSKLYKTANLLYSIYDYFALIIGLIIVFAAIFGLHLQKDFEEGYTFNSVIAGVFLTMVGGIFICFSIMSIQSRKAAFKKRRKYYSGQSL
jgi:uncharacterized membrane protein